MKNNIEHQYLKLVKDILDNGSTKETRNGGTISVFGRQIRHKMSEGFPLLTTKKMYWKGIVGELLWFLQGSTDIRDLWKYDIKIWDGDAYKNWVLKNSEPDQYWLTQEQFINRIKTDDEFAKKWGNLGPVYGKQWRSWGKNERIELVDNNRGDYEYEKITTPGIDQIANLINDLKTNPDSRRLMVTAWNPADLESSVLPPCHYGFQVYTRELSKSERYVHLRTGKYSGKWDGTGDEMEYYNSIGVPKRAISLMWSQRSVDTALGWPFNVASYGLLLELLGKMVNMIPDELICNLGDVHIYNNHIDGVKEQISREPYPLPKLNINTEWWPTESGECGVGPIDAQAVLRSFSDDNFCRSLVEEDLQLYEYQSHPKIYFPLSN